MTELGYKYNMTNIQASLLLPQFEKMGQYLDRRKRIYKYYQENIKGLRLLETNPGSSKLMFTIITKPNKRDKLLNLIQEEGVGVAVNFRAVPTLEFYKERAKYKGGEFPEAETIGGGTITLPLYPKMTDNQVEYVVEVIKRCLKRL
jgi:dTDP-4-amino-4,6-dideoxygalactose transaminase